MVDPSRDQHLEDGVAARDRALTTWRSSVAPGMIVIRPRELRELAHADLAAHGDYLVAAVERVLDHVPPELARRTNDADSRTGRATGLVVVLP